MIRLYKYLFYRAFDLIKLTGNFDLAWGASHFLSLTFSLGLINLMFFFKERIEWQVFGIVGVFIFVTFHIVNYFLFLKENKYRIIIEYFGKESGKQRRVGRLISIIVLVGLIYSLF